MPLHRFAVNVPNPAAKDVAVTLLLKPMARAALTGLRLPIPRGELKVTGVGLTLDPCGEAGARTLKLKLKPSTSVEVWVVVTTGSTGPRGGGAAAFHLVDRRAGTTGGVTVVVVDPPSVQPSGSLVKPTRPCRLVLATAVYAVPSGGDPSLAPSKKLFNSDGAVDLVAPITNRTENPIEDAKVYLEHLGGCDASFSPICWNAGTLKPGDVFFATWPLQLRSVLPGSYAASIVVASRRADPTRLDAPIRILEESKRSSNSGARRPSTRRASTRRGT